jgi:hypothetical protein
MFAVTIEQDPKSEISAEKARQALDLLLLPKISALWQSWVESGLLTLEEGEGGRCWKVNGAQEEALDGDESE